MLRVARGMVDSAVALFVVLRGGEQVTAEVPTRLCLGEPSLRCRWGFKVPGFYNNRRVWRLSAGVGRSTVQRARRLFHSESIIDLRMEMQAEASQITVSF